MKTELADYLNAETEKLKLEQRTALRLAAILDHLTESEEKMKVDSRRVRQEAEAALVIYETLRCRFAAGYVERGDPIAANLLGTLNNSSAPLATIQSLTDDLKWVHWRAVNALHDNANADH